MRLKSTKTYHTIPGLPQRIEHATSRREYYVTGTDAAQNTIYLQPVEGGAPVSFVLSRVMGEFGLKGPWREVK